MTAYIDTGRRSVRSRFGRTKARKRAKILHKEQDVVELHDGRHLGSGSSSDVRVPACTTAAGTVVFRRSENLLGK